MTKKNLDNLTVWLIGIVIAIGIISYFTITATIFIGVPKSNNANGTEINDIVPIDGYEEPYKID